MRLSAQSAPTAFFSKTYDETMGLLVEVRNYVAQDQKRDRAELAPSVGALLCCEALRVTARLTQVMAWLLAQKAIHAGELSAAQVVAQNGPLAEIAICMAEEAGEEHGFLPQYFRDLLDRSRRLYLRVARLDEMVRRNAG
jgi:regulator of CtrA degradation